MREEKEIREALKRLKDEHLRRTRQPADSSIYTMLNLLARIGTLEWVLGDKERFPDFAFSDKGGLAEGIPKNQKKGPWDSNPPTPLYTRSQKVL